VDAGQCGEKRAGSGCKSAFEELRIAFPMGQGVTDQYCASAIWEGSSGLIADGVGGVRDGQGQCSFSASVGTR